ncbi:L-type lectin-domain containing receptor kinase S.4-like, partial [Asparagus officinalis]|uniref:L-type lectin-domain containing receptor kinase S.4-like n=1 Tax=Asparagus officinalis TaxID=4686 RepID=UPI00098E4A1B
FPQNKKFQEPPNPLPHPQFQGPPSILNFKLSIDIATHLQSSEIINSDKIQVYLSLDITTNKIPSADHRGVPRHLLGSHDPASSFSTDFSFALIPEYPKLGSHARLRLRPLPNYITNSSDYIFAVEFDTVQDFEFFDINDNHVGVDINNLTSNKSAATAYFDDAGSKVGLNLKSGDKIHAWIAYDGAAKLLNVTLSPFSSKPKNPPLIGLINLLLIY